MKRGKVQAQRKFAQGAYIPQTNNSSQSVRVDHNVTPTKEERSIVHHSLAAKTLLDIISFQSTHSHAQPRVVLQRLEETQNGHPSPTEPDNLANTPSIQPSVSEPSTRKTNITEKHKKEGKIVIRKKIAYAPQAAAPYKTKGAINHELSSKQCDSHTLRPMRKKVQERQGSSSDFDDETPLSLAKLRKQNDIQETSQEKGNERTPCNTEKITRRKSDKELKDEGRGKKEMTSLGKSSLEKKVIIKKNKNRQKLTRKNMLRKGTVSEKSTLQKCDRITRSSQGHENLQRLHTKNKEKIENFSTVTGKVIEGLHTTLKSKEKEIIKKKKVLSQNSENQMSDNNPNNKNNTTSNSPSKDPMRANSNPSNSEIPSADQAVFLDVLARDSLHVVRVVSGNVQNQNKGMMRARLTPKSQANTTQDLSLVENEPILGPILQTFKLDKKYDIDISDDSDDCVIIKQENSGPKKRHVESSSFLHSLDIVSPLEAPTYCLTEEEFNDPIAFFEKIAPAAAKYGVCKIVAPHSYKPKCVLDDEMSFHVTNQYIGRLYNRWGPAMREMCAIKAYLASLNISFRAPLLDHLELNIPKLHRLVQRNGGLSQVLEMNQWQKVAEEMRIYKASAFQALDRICMKILLPYDTLSTQERQQLLAKVEHGRNKKYQRLMAWSINPLHRQKKLLGESDSSEEETEEDPYVAIALKEAEDCIVKGKTMTLNGFKKVAEKAKDSCIGRDQRTSSEIEEEYWRLVLLGTDHVCVNAASIDTAKSGYGFMKSKTDPKARHSWNLKMVSQNSGNALRSLGSVVGATVPTLHFGMVFSTSCWHRDPHGLPWLEYMHTGPPKIWYGIPDEQSAMFRKAVETLCPTFCQNKSIWLPSDITMIPPELLRSHGVAMARVEQKPGEYIMVFPKAYSCSISTGYTVSESVYFATDSWLKDVNKVFQELRESCEPTTFSLEQLLMSLALDPRSRKATLLLVRDPLAGLVAQEICYRKQLQERGLSVVQESRSNKPSGAASDAWNDQEECEVCRTMLYWSKVTLKVRKTAVCLKHGLRLLDSQRISAGNMQLVTMFSQKQLDQAVQSLIAATT